MTTAYTIVDPNTGCDIVNQSDGTDMTNTAAGVPSPCNCNCSNCNCGLPPFDSGSPDFTPIVPYLNTAGNGASIGGFGLDFAFARTSCNLWQLVPPISTTPIPNTNPVQYEQYPENVAPGFMTGTMCQLWASGLELNAYIIVLPAANPVNGQTCNAYLVLRFSGLGIFGGFTDGFLPPPLVIVYQFFPQLQTPGNYSWPESITGLGTLPLGDFELIQGAAPAELGFGTSNLSQLYTANWQGNSRQATLPQIYCLEGTSSIPQILTVNEGDGNEDGFDWSTDQDYNLVAYACPGLPWCATGTTTASPPYQPPDTPQPCVNCINCSTRPPSTPLGNLSNTYTIQALIRGIAVSCPVTNSSGNPCTYFGTFDNGTLNGSMTLSLNNPTDPMDPCDWVINGNFSQDGGGEIFGLISTTQTAVATPGGCQPPYGGYDDTSYDNSLITIPITDITVN